MIAETNYDVRIRLGTALTRDTSLLEQKAPVDFAELTLLDLIDSTLQQEYEGSQEELAKNVTNILKAKRFGVLVDYALEVNGKPARQTDKAVNYLDSMMTVSGESPYKTFTIRVTKRDGGGVY
ncbi:MAG TPA: hypothetical protein HA360_00055 [Nanoarchaeota archaeon]|nr:hypothetical protein [Candidatus Woesearchaeota archaeon]HIH15349.1 hypothetical protein [Nanoarchaeota archaeon]HIH59239.1 hypothetical protein [Nanoarchaeota archaeon]HII13446.1 hypothetical protein [Nanoarchaeota archaeon]HIJ05535.1 hypothetical protein [Nanoarchaeota archaeon]